MTAGVLGEAEDAGEIDVDDGLPVFVGVVDGGGAADDAGVVDENVDGAKVLDGFFNEALADGGIANVTGEGDAPDSGFGDEVLRVLRRILGAVNSNIGSGLREGDGDGRAEAARGAGNECCLSLEVELFEYRWGAQWSCPFR